MRKRKAIRKSVRFGVFRRDGFTLPISLRQEAARSRFGARSCYPAFQEAAMTKSPNLITSCEEYLTPERATQKIGNAGCRSLIAR